MKLTTLKVDNRDAASKGALSAMRADGMIPAVFYGKTQEPINISVNEAELRKVMGSKRYELLDLEIDGQSGNPAIIYEFERDIITQKITHVDFLEIKEDRELKIRVPIVLEGVPYGVKSEGGSLLQPTKRVRIACLPENIVNEYVLDISEAKSRTTFYAKDLNLVDATLVSNARAVIYTISKGRNQEEEEEE